MIPRGVIGHINLAKGFRGGERQTELLIRGLSAAGYSQRLVCRKDEALQQRISELHGLDIRPVSGLTTAAGALRACALIHVHQGRSVYPAAVAGALGGIPYVITRRIAVAPGTGPLTRWAYRRAARVVGVSQAAADIMVNHVSRERIAMVFSASSGLSMNAAHVSAIRDRFPGRFIVGCIGALDQKQKGQAFLIDVARRCESEQPELQFLFVGSGHDEQLLRERASGLSNVCFEGFRDNVGDYLAAMDLFAMPSLMEGLGGILIDAMKFGLPAVATSIPGLREVMVHDETGLLIPPADPNALHQAIIELYKDRDRRTRMASAARNRASMFAVEKMIEGYQRIYLEVLSEADV